MSDKELIEYDYGSALSFIGSLQTICGLLAGFLFTGTTVILSTLTEPVTLLSQIVLFILYFAMGLFISAIYELNSISNLICSYSPKWIIPPYPDRWRLINRLIIMGSFFGMISIPLMFLLKNLIILFILSICQMTVGFMIESYRWKRLLEEMGEKRFL